MTGRSGSGKTTLLRSLADLWPFADGTVRRPLGGEALFLSQQPYVPLGTLRAALAYPGRPRPSSTTSGRAVLRPGAAPQLADRLDDETDWARRLSPGEQQRLGFARVLLARPRVVFLDEATSASTRAWSTPSTRCCATSCRTRSWSASGHRSTLNRFHAERLELLGDGRWQVATLSH